MGRYLIEEALSVHGHGTKLNKYTVWYSKINKTLKKYIKTKQIKTFSSSGAANEYATEEAKKIRGAKAYLW